MESSPPLSAEQVRERAVRGALTVTMRGFVIRALGLLGTVILARLLSPGDFGIVAVGFSLVILGNFLAEAGLGAALVRGSAEPGQDKLSAVLGFHLLVSLPLAALGGSVALLWLPRDADVVAVMFLAVPAAAWRIPGTIVLERRLDYGPIAFVEVAEIAAYQVWAVASVALGAGVWGLASATVIRTAVGSCLMIRAAPPGFVRPRISFPAIGPIFRFGLQYQAGSGISVLRENLISAGVLAVAGASVLGLWSLAQRILLPALVVLEALARVSFAAMARYLEGSPERAEIPSATVKLVAPAAGLVLTVLACATPGAIPTVFGEKWVGAADIVPLACLGLGLSAPVTVGAVAYLYARGEAGAALLSMIATAVLTVGVTVVGLPLVGPVALGIAAVVGAAGEVLVLDRTVRKRGSGSLFAALGAPLAAGLIASVTGLLVSDGLGGDLLAAAAATVAGSVVYLAIALATAREAVLASWGLLRAGMRRKASPSARRA